MSFFISNDLLVSDIVTALSNYGIPVEVFVHVHPGIKVKNGKFDVYLRLAGEQTAETIPQVMELGG